MTLRVVREPTTDGATLGVLFVNGRFQCFTLEDAIREVPGQSVNTWKVPRETAIPAGAYRLALTYSQRFGRVLPLVVDVPGFSGVRIHPGNTIADTEGCILLGRTRVGNAIAGSRIAVEELLFKLSPDEQHRIVLENPPAAVAA